MSDDNRFSQIEIEYTPSAPVVIPEEPVRQIEIDDVPASAPEAPAAPVAAAAPAPAAPVAAPAPAPATTIEAVARELAPSRPAARPAVRLTPGIEYVVRFRDRVPEAPLAPVAPAPLAPVAPAPAVRKPAARDLVALSERSEISGLMLFWNFSGTVSVPDFEAAWSATGLSADLAPKIVSAEVALTRAVRSVCGKAADGSRLIARSLDGGGWAVVEEVQDGEIKRFRHVVSAILNAAENGPVVTGAEAEGIEVSDLRQDITAAFDALRADLTSSDLGTWLARVVVPALDGVSLRESGGIYYLPASATANADRVIALVRDLQCGALYAVPAVSGSDSIRAALDGLAAEVATLVSEVRDAIAGVAVGERIHGRTARTRQEQIAALLAKLARYEGLLGADLGASRAALMTMSDAILDRSGDLRASLLEIDP